MNTHIQNLWKMPKNPIYVALGWFVLGSFLGYVVGHPPRAPMTCHAPMLRAHFLERQLAFETSTFRLSSSSSTESLRAAAPDEELSESGESSVAPVVPNVIALPIVLPVLSSDSSSSVAPVALHASSENVSSAESASSSASALSESTSASSSSASSVDTDFPAMGNAVFPVGRAPNWGAMKTPAQWERSYDEMTRDDFVRIPAYDLDVLTTPMKTLTKTRDDPQTIDAITAKLFYSTRFFGSYNLDAGEFSGDHAGIDFKLPEGMPVSAAAGGRVNAVIREESGLGLHVIIEHRDGDETFYSIYGHLSVVNVRQGQSVGAGDVIGSVGSTGRSSGPHLHFQVDVGTPNEAPHAVYWPGRNPGRGEALRHTMHPIGFIAQY